MLKYSVCALLLFFSINGIAPAVENDVFEVEAEGSYPMVEGGSIDLAKKMSLFTAKKKAVESAGRYLSREGLIDVFELEKDEIYSLTAGEIHAEILEQKRKTVGKTSIYHVRNQSPDPVLRFSSKQKSQTANRKKMR